MKWQGRKNGVIGVRCVSATRVSGRIIADFRMTGPSSKPTGPSGNEA